METLATMFWSRVERSGNVVAQLVRHEGGWRASTWSQVGDVVRELALGLVALGRQRGDAVALLSRSRAEWVQADFAIFAAGDVTVPIYPTYTPEQVAYIVNDSGARTLVVENATQLARLLPIRSAMPGLEQIVVIEGGTQGAPAVLSWAELCGLGRERADSLRRELAERVAAGRSDDVATIVYTSGTTGAPRGVIQTHGNHLAALRSVAQIPGVEPGDVHVLFLPLAHSFARLESFMGVHRGLVTAFAESLENVGQNLREVRPHFIFAVPRVFEKVRARILAEVDAASVLRRRVFAAAMRVGREASKREQEKRPVERALRLERRVAQVAVFSRLGRALGGRLRFAVSGGAPLAREICEFFHAAGILIVEGYGLTEACPVLTFNRIDHFKFGSVGQAVPGVELKIAPDGEILARGPNVASRGYIGQPEATAETFGPDGWLRTGDIGRIDEEGFVYVTDRKKELIVTSGGVNIAPQPIENILRSDPFVGQAMICGDRHPYPTALITLNPDALAGFARDQGILVTDAAELAHHPKVIDRVGRVVEATNQRLPSYAQIEKFTVLPRDFTEEGGELTPTQKVKRKVVAEKYAAVIDGLYA